MLHDHDTTMTPSYVLFMEIEIPDGIFPTEDSNKFAKILPDMLNRDNDTTIHMTDDLYVTYTDFTQVNRVI
jgi:hypothetical protein